jgi:hypothetical protein
MRSKVLMAVMLLSAAPAWGQPSNVEARMAIVAEHRGEQVRVQVNVNFFVPGRSDDSEASQRAQERARRVVYEMAARECGLLRDVIASDCRIENINVNINRHSGQQPEGFQAGGNFSFRITMK